MIYPYPRDVDVKPIHIGDFGKAEMESTARTIVRWLQRPNSWEVGFSLDDIRAEWSISLRNVDVSSLLDGFKGLINGGLLTEHHETGEYYVNQSFLKRILK